MDTPDAHNGYRRIFADLSETLRHSDIGASAVNLGLSMNTSGEAEVPFLGTTFLVSVRGIRCSDGRNVTDVAGSVVARYLIHGSRCRPSGRFVTFAALAGPLFTQGSYSVSALERPICTRFQGRVTELMESMERFGGRREGEAGLGSVSLIVDLLPHIPLQLVFYDRDDEYPARATVLFDGNATELLDFETLAVAVTVFVNALTKQ